MLGHGEVLEFDSPSVLLSNSASQFYSLVEQTGEAEAVYLRSMARTAALTAKLQNKRDDEVQPDDSSERDPLI